MRSLALLGKHRELLSVLLPAAETWQAAFDRSIRHMKSELFSVSRLAKIVTLSVILLTALWPRHNSSEVFTEYDKTLLRGKRDQQAENAAFAGLDRFVVVVLCSLPQIKFTLPKCRSEVTSDNTTRYDCNSSHY